MTAGEVAPGCPGKLSNDAQEAKAAAKAASETPFRKSRVSRYMECQLQEVGVDQPDGALLASLADVVDPILRAEYLTSEGSRPKAKDVVRNIQMKDRCALIAWMLQAFDSLDFSDDLLHGTTLTFDRFCACSGSCLDLSTVQTVLLAIVCTELKLANLDDLPSRQWQQLVQHLSRGHISLQAVLHMELYVLTRLHFAVGIPTALTFLRELTLRLPENEVDVDEDQLAREQGLALFLLELALFDPEVQYRHPHAVLAAGALHAAKRALGTGTAIPDRLLEDLSAYGLLASDGLVACCAEELLVLWRKCACAGHHEVPYMLLRAKFCRTARLGDSLPAPPP
mmetsp:Transcript_22198/g.49115  ORF Transcript_22198/g.49115 Transcript_22198/m.49115 type:complete len:339 (-) Transcript_22198:123-1139(-)